MPVYPAGAVLAMVPQGRKVALEYELDEWLRG